MRKATLFRSVQRFLEEGSSVSEAAYMWTRHRLMVPFSVAAFLGVVFVSAWAGFEDWATRLVLGLAGVAVAVSASTDYKVLALTSEGLLLLQASRIRQFATKLLDRLPADAPVERVGGTVLAADWAVAGVVYTVPRSSEQAMQRIGAPT